MKVENIALRVTFFYDGVSHEAVNDIIDGERTLIVYRFIDPNNPKEILREITSAENAHYLYNSVIGLMLHVEDNKVGLFR